VYGLCRCGSNAESHLNHETHKSPTGLFYDLFLAGIDEKRKLMEAMQNHNHEKK